MPRCVYGPSSHAHLPSERHPHRRPWAGRRTCLPNPRSSTTATGAGLSVRVTCPGVLVAARSRRAAPGEALALTRSIGEAGGTLVTHLVVGQTGAPAGADLEIRARPSLRTVSEPAAAALAADVARVTLATPHLTAEIRVTLVDTNATAARHAARAGGVPFGQAAVHLQVTGLRTCPVGQAEETQRPPHATVPDGQAVTHWQPAGSKN